MVKSKDEQISLTDPDARSMATSSKDTGIVGYNVQAAVDTRNHLIVAHEVTNVGTDRHQLSNISEQARTEMGVETLDAVADRGYTRARRFAVLGGESQKPLAALVTRYEPGLRQTQAISPQALYRAAVSMQIPPHSKG